MCPEPTDARGDGDGQDSERRAIAEDAASYFASTEAPFSPAPDPADVADSLFDFDPLTVHERATGYWVSEPAVYTAIRYDPDEHRYLYRYLEPQLSEFEQSVYDDLLPTVRRVLLDEEFERTEEGTEAFEARLRELLGEYTTALDPLARWKLLYYFRRDFVGFGELDPMMGDPHIEDISCDGADIPVYVYHDEYGDVQSSLSFEADPLQSMTVRLAQRAGRHVSASYPLLTTTLPDGSRVQVTLGDDVVTRGSNFTIRKFSEEPFTPTDLLTYRTFSIEQVAYLWLAIEHNCSILFVGPTASGKTTSMNALSLFIPPDDKVVSIEETREIELPHDNWIADLTREQSVHGEQPEIGMYELLDEALHQRPDYLLVGEIRTDPDVVLTFFQAMGTGHDGFTTFHAESSRDALRRLTHNPLNIPYELVGDIDVISVQHLIEQQGANARRCRQLTEVRSPETAGTETEPRPGLEDVFTYDTHTDAFDQVAKSRLLAEIADDEGWSADRLRTELERRRTVLTHLLETETASMAEVTRLLFRFECAPERVLEELADVEPHGDPVKFADDPLTH